MGEDRKLEETVDNDVGNICVSSEILHVLSNAIREYAPWSCKGAREREGGGGGNRESSEGEIGGGGGIIGIGTREVE